MILEVVTYPDPRLQQVSTPVTEFDSKLHQLLEDMKDTMYAENGIGLAAIQVGVAQRIFIMDLGKSEEEPRGELFEFINPQFVEGEGSTVFEEGCLSVPGFTAEVKRFQKVTIKFQDRNGKPQQIEAEDLLAVCAQHENDHLEGILFIDRLSPLKRQLLKRKIAKSQFTL